MADESNKITGQAKILEDLLRMSEGLDSFKQAAQEKLDQEGLSVNSRRQKFQSVEMSKKIIDDFRKSVAGQQFQHAQEQAAQQARVIKEAQFAKTSMPPIFSSPSASYDAAPSLADSFGYSESPLSQQIMRNINPAYKPMQLPIRRIAPALSQPSFSNVQQRGIQQQLPYSSYADALPITSLQFLNEDQRAEAKRFEQKQGKHITSMQEVGDIERVISGRGGQGTQKGISDLTDSLKKLNTAFGSDLIKKLDELKNELSENSDSTKKYREALKEYQSAKDSGDKERIARAFDNMSNQNRIMMNTIGQMEAAVETSMDQLAGGGGNKRTGAQILGQASLMGGFALQATAGALRDSFGVYQRMEGRDITAQREITQQRGALGQQQYDIISEQNNLMDPRNALKWAGNIIAPGMFKYSGTQGFERAKQESFKELAREQKLLEQERNIGGLGDIGGIGGKLLQGGGQMILQTAATSLLRRSLEGGVAGALSKFIPGVNVATGAYLLGSVVKDVYGAYQKYEESQANRPEGGVAGTLLGSTVNKMFGLQPTEDVVSRTRELYGVEKSNELIQKARERQEAEVNRFPFLQQGYGQIQTLKDIRFRAASMVGGRAGIELSRSAENMKLDEATQEFQQQNKNNADFIANAAAETLSKQATETINEGIRKKNAEIRKKNAEFGLLPKSIRENESYKIPQIKAPEIKAPEIKPLLPEQVQTTIDVAKSEMLAQGMQKSFENYVSGYKPTWYNKLGMNQMEIEQRKMQFINAAGAGEIATGAKSLGAQEAVFQQMNKLGMAGVGSYEQLTGNVNNLMGLRGGTFGDNQKQLEKVLEAGVSKGFDNSRLAQQFVSSTTDLAKSMDLSSVRGLAESLARGAGIGGGGRADERTLQQAIAGTAQRAAFTGSQQGPMAALRMQAIVGSGIGIKEGLGTLFKMDAVKAQDVISSVEDLTGLKGDAAFEMAAKIANREIAEPKGKKMRDDLRMSLLQNKTNPKNYYKALTRIRDTEVTAFNWLNNLGGGADLQQQLSAIKGEKDTTKQQGLIENLWASVSAGGALTNDLDYKAIQSFLGTQMEQLMPEDKKGAAKLKKMIVEGGGQVASERVKSVAFQDAVTRFSQGILGKSAISKTGVSSIGQYADVMKAGALTDLEVGGKTYSQEQLRELEKSTDPKKAQEKSQVEAAIKGKTTGDLITERTMMHMDPSDTSKYVTIANISKPAADTLARAMQDAARINPSNIPIPARGN